MTGIISVAVLGLALLPGAVDIDAVKAEPNLEKRSEKALVAANQAITEAREAYDAGSLEKARELFTRAADLAELSHQSLQATGKSPRKSPKHFKKAEVAIRALLRRLTDLSRSVSVEDRPMVAEAEQRLHKVHEELLEGIMSKKH